MELGSDFIHPAERAPAFLGRHRRRHLQDGVEGMLLVMITALVEPCLWMDDISLSCHRHADGLKDLGNQVDMFHAS